MEVIPRIHQHCQWTWQPNISMSKIHEPPKKCGKKNRPRDDQRCSRYDEVNKSDPYKWNQSFHAFIHMWWSFSFDKNNNLLSPKRHTGNLLSVHCQISSLEFNTLLPRLKREKADNKKTPTTNMHRMVSEGITILCITLQLTQLNPIWQSNLIQTLTRKVTARLWQNNAFVAFIFMCNEW